jgi:hypothetical protein
MARVDELELVSMDRNAVHNRVQATYSTFQSENGDVYIQIDTYGSPERAFPGKKSQSLQFGPEGIAALRQILDSL